MIRIKNVTKDYGSNKGVFDLSFEVQDQETFGLLGMEGAGKTTLLQILMGFSNLSGGRCTINAKHCWKQSTGIKNFTGYLPQKITLPESMTGLQFFRFLADLRNRKSLEKAIRTADAFELDTSKKIRDLNQEEKKRFISKGDGKLAWTKSAVRGFSFRQGRKYPYVAGGKHLPLLPLPCRVRPSPRHCHQYQILRTTGARLFFWPCLGCFVQRPHIFLYVSFAETLIPCRK